MYTQFSSDLILIQTTSFSLAIFFVADFDVVFNASFFSNYLHVNYGYVKGTPRCTPQSTCNIHMHETSIYI